MPRYFWLAPLRSRVVRRTDRSRVVARRSPRLSVELLEARDVPALTLTIAPQSLSDGSTATGTLTRDGDLTAPLTVNLTSGDTTEATVPA
ncbi:MAG: hypothetical protein JWO38_3328 [Gemmataceae bacterium]|nr:hypothetical protein [Gemmataceae bacterium]